ncbi:unnamed protein product [Toxocara canis]|uniref:Solute carrier family 40 protein n=1 Tax=Toxocara canis TaxID=6265 RepID=A0A183UBH8_TOXCA|nr:unnamed protein product [Toxocara canis]
MMLLTQLSLNGHLTAFSMARTRVSSPCAVFMAQSVLYSPPDVVMAGILWDLVTLLASGVLYSKYVDQSLTGLLDPSNIVGVSVTASSTQRKWPWEWSRTSFVAELRHTEDRLLPRHDVGRHCCVD